MERVDARLKLFWGAEDVTTTGAPRFFAFIHSVLIVHIAKALHAKIDAPPTTPPPVQQPLRHPTRPSPPVSPTPRKAPGQTTARKPRQRNGLPESFGGEG